MEEETQQIPPVEQPPQQETKRFPIVPVLVGITVIILLVAGWFYLFNQWPFQGVNIDVNESVDDVGGIDTSNWEMYRKDIYGFTFGHPQGWYVYDGDDVGISLYDKKPPDNASSRGIQIYPHRERGVIDIKKWAESQPPLYTKDPSAPTMILEERGKYVTLDGIEAYQIYRKLIDRNIPFGCEGEDPKDCPDLVALAEAAKNVEHVIVITYVPLNTRVISISAHMSGMRGSDQEKKKIHPNDEREHLDTYNEILSTFKFIEPEIDTSDWKTYRNEVFGFEVMYPSSFSSSSDINDFTGLTRRPFVIQKTLNSSAPNRITFKGFEALRTATQGLGDVTERFGISIYDGPITDDTEINLIVDFMYLRQADKIITSGGNKTYIINNLAEPDSECDINLAFISYESKTVILSLEGCAVYGEFGYVAPGYQDRVVLFSKIVSTFK